MDHLRASAVAVERHLDRLAVVAPARRQAEDLVALLVGFNAAALERLIGCSASPEVVEADPELAELLWVDRPAPPDDAALAAPERIERTLASLERSGIGELVDEAAAVVEEVNDLYGRGLVRAIELLEAGGDREGLAAALADEAVAAALALHGLRPLADPDLAPGLAPAAGTGGDRSRPVGHEAFIPLASVGRRGRGGPPRWIELPELASIGPGDVTRLRTDAGALLACRIGADLYVALDPFAEGAGQGVGQGVGELRLELDGGGPPAVVAPGGARFVFDAPLPVQRDGDRYEVSVP